MGASEFLKAREYELFCEIRDEISESTTRIQSSAYVVAYLDVLCSLAEVAVKNHYTMPCVDTSDKIDIKGGRHPVVEKMLDDALFVPNDTYLDCNDNRMLIITGPNMAGKSTYMRQVAVIVLMAQIGSFVPADSCSIGVCDKIFTRVGASDDLSAGQSTFMVEMTEVAQILKRATKKVCWFLMKSDAEPVHMMVCLLRGRYLNILRTKRKSAPGHCLQRIITN